MKHAFAAVAFALIAPVALSAPVKPAAQDPVASFKAIVAEAGEQREWSRVYQNSRTQKWAKQYFAMGDVRYDVRKTDSLVNPMIGVVEFPITIQQSPFFESSEDAEQSVAREPFTMPYQIEITYHAEAAAWRLHELSYRSTDRESPLRGTKFTMDRAKLEAEKEKAMGSALQRWAR